MRTYTELVNTLVLRKHLPETHFHYVYNESDKLFNAHLYIKTNEETFTCETDDETKAACKERLCRILCDRLFLNKNKIIRIERHKWIPLNREWTSLFNLCAGYGISAPKLYFDELFKTYHLFCLRSRSTYTK